MSLAKVGRLGVENNYITQTLCLFIHRQAVPLQPDGCKLSVNVHACHDGNEIASDVNHDTATFEKICNIPSPVHTSSAMKLQANPVADLGLSLLGSQPKGRQLRWGLITLSWVKTTYMDRVGSGITGKRTGEA